jgi:transketolase
MSFSISRSFNTLRLRKTVLEMAFSGSTGHIGCAFSIVELLAVLHRSFLKYPNNDPLANGRDYLVLSKGHGVMAQYACMRELGWIGDLEISTYYSNNSTLKGLSDSRIPGLEVTSGSLGHGFSVGVGLALGAKLNASGQRVFAVVGDGELNEGTIWEGAMFASHWRLDNFNLIVDKNGFQAMGLTKDIIDLGAIKSKLECFGFDALEVDGHDEDAIETALEALSTNASGNPKALIAKTVKGKGVPFMENNNIWHYTRLTPETYKQALASLEGDAP